MLLRPIVLMPVVLGLVASLTASSTQFAPSSSGVSISIEVAKQLSLHEPVTMRVIVSNARSETAFVDFGKNAVGHLQFVHTKPDGTVLNLDPRRPRQADESYFHGVIRVAPKSRSETEILLTEWLDFSAIGVHRLKVEFIGNVLVDTHQNLDVTRDWTRDIEILPRNEQSLRVTCERLVRQIQSTKVPDDALRAANKLAHVKDPIAVEYLLRAIEGPKPVYIDLIPIRGLERIATNDARNALLKVSGNRDIDTARAALAAIDRLDRKRQ